MLAAFTLSAAALLAVAPVAFGDTASVIAPQSLLATPEEAAILASIDNRIAAIQAIANQAAPSAACVKQASDHFLAIYDIIAKEVQGNPLMIVKLGVDRYDTYMRVGGSAQEGSTATSGGDATELVTYLNIVKHYRAQLN